MRGSPREVWAEIVNRFDPEGVRSVRRRKSPWLEEIGEVERVVAFWVVG